MLELLRRLQVLALLQAARLLRDDVGLDALELDDEVGDVFARLGACAMRSGVLPLRMEIGAPIKDDFTPAETAPPNYVLNYNRAWFAESLNE